MKYKVIDNFLDKKYFDSLVELFIEKDGQDTSEQLPWFYQREINTNHNVAKDNLFYMTSMLYEGNQPTSPFYKDLFPILLKLDVVCLLRIKANLYPSTETLQEHAMHSDRDYHHSGAILSLNTCDGYTKLGDGTKINSVANRILLFDASDEHCSTTTTNVPARFNININYIQEQWNIK